MKFLIKLAIAALIANAAWRVGMEYVAHYRFTDSVNEAMIGHDESEQDLRRRVLELAMQQDIPLKDDDFTVRSQDRESTWRAPT